MVPNRELYWHIENKWIFYLISLPVLLFVVAMFAYYFYLWKKNKHENSEIRFESATVLNVLKEVILGFRIIKNQISAGIMHMLIFWGFVILLIGTFLLSLHEHVHPFIYGGIYIAFSLLMEIGGLMLLSGLLFALFRRYILNVSRLEKRFEDFIIPTWLILIILSGFLIEGIRIGAHPNEFERWSFLGWWIKGFISPSLLDLYPIFWWGHALLSLGFLAFIPLSKMFHIIGAPISIYLQNLPQKNANSGLLKEGEQESLGEEGLLEEKEDSPSKEVCLKDMVFLDSCMRCGRCVEVCPSTGVREDYSPREFVQALRGVIWKRISGFGDIRILNRGLDEGRIKNIWHCTTCGACLEVCPVYGPTFLLVLAQRSLAIEEGILVPDLLNQTLERLYKYENPWLPSKKEKLNWIEEDLHIKFLWDKGEPIELCYFVGCTTSIDARARSIARSFTKILNKLNINFGIFGDKEPCCGDIAKRVGELGLFEEKMLTVADLFESNDIKEVVTSSPHCYYTFKKDYPDMGINIYHYTLFLHKLLKENVLQFSKKMELKVTYHDPCYLGRHSRIFDEPRNIIKSIPGIELTEMPHHRENSLCCGGGGGRMWQGNELYGERRMSERRAEEAIGTGADVIITACPLCLIMMEDAIKTLGYDKKVKVMDLNELILLAL